MPLWHCLSLLVPAQLVAADALSQGAIADIPETPTRYPWQGQILAESWAWLAVLAALLLLAAALGWRAWRKRRAQASPPERRSGRPADPKPAAKPKPAAASKPSAAPKPAAPPARGAKAGATLAAADPVNLVDGKYLLLQELGRGGMGVVYEAENTRLGKHVALKIMREELRFNPRDRRKFLEEARNLAKLEHANVVGILDVLEEPDQETWLVMELVRGRTLKDRLDVEERIPFDEARRIMLEVLKALDYVHRKKVVHRDLKPGNVMLGDEGQVKVMDFGIARQVKDLVTRTTGADSSGTMAYMGPEQHLGRFDARTDLFAFGVVFYETLCGELPFQAGDLLLAKKMKLYKPLAELGVKLPEAAWALIQQCLEPDMDERPADAAEALKRLQKV